MSFTELCGCTFGLAGLLAGWKKLISRCFRLTGENPPILQFPPANLLSVDRPASAEWRYFFFIFQNFTSRSCNAVETRCCLDSQSQLPAADRK